MNKNKKDWHYQIAGNFKERDNPKEYKPCEAIVVSLNPVVLTVSDGKVRLVENKNLIVSEWFKKRWDIDKTEALSVGVLADLASAEGVTEIHSYGGSPCGMPNAIGFLASAITKINTELLSLKMDLKINDKVIIVPSSQADVFFLVDKVLSDVPE